MLASLRKQSQGVRQLVFPPEGFALLFVASSWGALSQQHLLSLSLRDNPTHAIPRYGSQITSSTG
ncbi:hypothetical protein H634G_11688 [Metarhizium anisopliae BRIP 53293]|uniref:Uncharacterized protein n=1 Tax=Metarhizium anisopliae BRIP 53293 TaxID=1291518 RepID=A0A0D9NKW6_METAN|nr:hypothetical protein H634G_11688 [Metarhizium anisopliae BRIP 53293]